jgi:hypothetical protein
MKRAAIIMQQGKIAPAATMNRHSLCQCDNGKNAKPEAKPKTIPTETATKNDPGRLRTFQGAVS